LIKPTNNLFRMFAKWYPQNIAFRIYSECCKMISPECRFAYVFRMYANWYTQNVVLHTYLGCTQNDISRTSLCIRTQDVRKMICYLCYKYIFILIFDMVISISKTIVKIFDPFLCLHKIIFTIIVTIRLCAKITSKFILKILQYIYI